MISLINIDGIAYAVMRQDEWLGVGVGKLISVPCAKGYKWNAIRIDGSKAGTITSRSGETFKIVGENFVCYNLRHAASILL